MMVEKKKSVLLLRYYVLRLLLLLVTTVKHDGMSSIKKKTSVSNAGVLVVLYGLFGHCNYLYATTESLMTSC